jgi:preprotein translocase subunit YajC
MFKIISFVSSSLLALNSSLTWAQGAPTQPPEGGLLLQLPFILGMFALFYFVLIRPQRQQAKKHAEFVSQLGRGDEVVLSSGFIGKIVGLTDRVASVEISDGVEVKVLRTQIQSHAKALLEPQAAIQNPAQK